MEKMPNKTGKHNSQRNTLTCDTGDPQEGMEKERVQMGEKIKESSSKHITKITKEVGKILEL